jgi:uncharacterized protein
MTEITVFKLDEQGRKVWQYPARLLARGENFVCLEASFNRPDVDLGFTTFKQGDLFIEYFYSDRWYNLFAVYDRDDGEFKGWYANICRPAHLEARAVRCEDLALDLWISPQGQATLLDEPEFEALPLNAQERARSREAVEELQQRAAQGLLPRTAPNR